MLTDAINKLRAEMDNNTNNPYIQAIGEFLLQHLETNPGAAENIISTDKTILNSLDEMKKAAEKKRVGNCAVLTGQEGFEIVLKYFGIDAVAPAKVILSNEKKMAPGDVDFDIKLEDLI